MRKLKLSSEKGCISAKRESEKGAALVITILVMLLLIGFVTLVISRVSTETIITSVDSSENQALAATQANLESTSRDFADIFERKLVPTAADITTIKSGTISGFGNYNFNKEIRQTDAAQPTMITGGTYSGLYSLRDVWEIDITAKDKATNVETQLRRRLLNDRIPLFQFGIFYEGDLELNRPPLFTFGGRVHTNSNLFISASPVWNGDGIYFRSKATVVGEIVNDIWKTGTPLTTGHDDQGSVFVADGGGNFQELKTYYASVKCVNPSGPNVFADKPNLPNCSKRTAWNSDKLIFQSNLDTQTQRLDLPLKKSGVAFNELIKRSKNVDDLMSNGTGGTTPVSTATQDNVIISRERFANKQGMRISLSDSQAKLPGCVGKTGADDCGVRLDRTATVLMPAMLDALTYKTTPLNAARFAQSGREVWIKVESVDYDYNNNVPLTKDITKEILSLGVTEPAPIGSDFQIFGYDAQQDSRSIIKLQRITMPGQAVPNGSTSYLTNRSIGGSEHNIALRYTNVPPLVPLTTGICNPGSILATAKDSFAEPFPSKSYSEESTSLLCAKFNNDSTKGFDVAIAPFPIEIFDGREGIPTDDSSYTGGFNSNEVPSAGVMSMIDIDVANLKKFLNGDFDGKFPIAGTPFSTANLRALKSSDIPENRGWVLYISDRRGDADFDGEYDMEDVFPDGILQFNEDINGLTNDILGNGVLERAFGSEAPGSAGGTTIDSYKSAIPKSQAASADHGYYRRGVRLINGKELPGSYNSANPSATKGFTVASENGVYVRGNYNATSVTLSGNSSPALPENYFPQGDADVPASIVSDAVMILSNNWNDAKSFREPFNVSSRKATPTIVRFAMLSGQGLTGKSVSGAYVPSQFGQLNGGVHNFKRYLESWKSVRLNYSGSLVNLFTSRNNNGFFKCCVVYEPPFRDWTFDKTFLDPNRLPPGTPYIYTMAFTGFERVSE